MPALKGVTLKDKLDNLVSYFEDIERDDKVGISIDGYEKMLLELNDILPKTKDILKKEFELQEENVMKSSYLLDYNIKPIDVLEIIPEDELAKFCNRKSIKTRGDIVINILECYRDAENLYLENYSSIGYRDLASLKENGIIVKESGYNKFSSVSRQLKSYMALAEKYDYKVIKSLLIAPEFSDDFVKDCGLDYELNLLLITANSLSKILEVFKTSKHKSFPHNLLMRDVLIQEERIIKSIGK